MGTTAMLDHMVLTYKVALDVPDDKVAGEPALPDCLARFVPEPDPAGPWLRWETLEERDARLHAAWFAQRMFEEDC